MTLWSIRFARILGVLAAGILLLCFGDSRAAELPALSEIRAGLQQRSDSFAAAHSFYIECNWCETDHLFLDSTAERDVEMLLLQSKFGEIQERFRSVQPVMTTPGYKYMLGKRGEKLYSKVVNPLDRKFGAEGQTGVFEGLVGVELQESSNAIITTAPPAAAWQFWVYAELLHLNVYRDIPGGDVLSKLPEARRPILLPEDISAHERDYVVAGSDSVDGIQCIVIERPGIARFWLSREDGYALRRAELYWKTGAAPVLKARRTMQDLREVRPGLWLPWRIVEEIGVDPTVAGRYAPGTVAIRQVLCVSKMEFDSLSDDFFRIQIPAGTTVHDTVRAMTFVSGDSGEPFTRAIEYAAAKSTRTFYKFVGLIAGNVAVALLVVWYWRRRAAR